MAANVPDAFRDLLDASFATFATVGPDGHPQLSEIWFLHDGGELKVSLHSARQKTKNLRRNPAVNLFILDIANPMRYLEVRGDATLVDDTDYEFADRVGAKYGGVDLRQMDGDDRRRVVVTINPTRVVAVDMSR
ncbi:MAG TPA: PPOX class F420-dependent oxidoreductase [Ilumatobacteraceae bacterium]|jgi:PPOX class probable F420-dependent enzyme